MHAPLRLKITQSDMLHGQCSILHKVVIAAESLWHCIHERLAEYRWFEISNSMTPCPSVLHAYTNTMKPVIGILGPTSLDEVSNRIPPTSQSTDGTCADPKRCNTVTWKPRLRPISLLRLSLLIFIASQTFQAVPYGHENSTT